MAPLLALLAAVSWGSSDFAAGYASRRSSALSVVVLTHLASAAALTVVVIDVGALVGTGRLLGTGSPSLDDLGWGLAAGFGGGVGALLLFRGLGSGSMAVVAPITAAGAAAVPAIVGPMLGDALTVRSMFGVALALTAIVLVSMTAPDTDPPDREFDDLQAPAHVDDKPMRASPQTSVLVRPLQTLHRQRGVTDAIGSGLGFGLFFVCISRAGEAAGYWPLLLARGASATIFALIAFRRAGAILPAPRSRWSVVLAGVLDAVAAILFVVSTRTGLLSINAVLASLYPVATIFLARVVVGERIRGRQAAGLAVAGLAVVTLAL